MKPVLLLSCRPEDAAAMQERELVLRFGRLADHEVEHHRVEAVPLPELDITHYRAVIMGGSPFNASNPDKSELQRRVEADLYRVIKQALATETPFLGLCFGVGTLTNLLGGIVDGTHAETTSMTDVELTPEGQADPIFAGVPAEFQAFTGHKECCAQLPPGAVLLATGPTCPVQAYRFGASAYVTQFHPELDGAALADRMIIYQHYGYFAADDLEMLLEFARSTEPTPQVHWVLSNFVALAGELAGRQGAA